MKYKEYMKLALGSYFPMMEGYIMKKSFISLLKELKGTEGLCPEFKWIFRSFRLTPIDKLSVVWLGQDPYHNGHAIGLSFGVPSGVKLNPSLRYILKELSSNLKKNIPDNFDTTLAHWAKSGCLMVNASLTTERGRAGAHRGLWTGFTEHLYKQLNGFEKPLVFVHLGKDAQSMNNLITQRHTIVNAAHPAAHVYSKNAKFLGSKLFIKIDATSTKKIRWIT